VKIFRCIVCVLFLYVPKVWALEYTTQPLGSCQQTLLLKGRIEPNDAAAFLKVLAQVDAENNRRSCKLSNIKLTSTGGDVDEAMKIGRVIRTRELFTEVGVDDQCLSSCVLILGAGVVRSVFEARIGIHRPYFVALDKGLSTAEIRDLRKQMISRMKVYADEMDLSERLIDEMMSIPPEQIKILSFAQLAEYRLSGVDASFDEKRTNNFAQEIGITSSELRKRTSEADKRCDSQFMVTGRGADPERWTRCRQAIIWDISEAEYVARERLIANKCSGMADGSTVRWNCVMKTMREGR
jgi:hypothetical protein